MRRFPRRAALAALALVGGYYVARSLELRMPDSGASRTASSAAPATGLAGIDPDGNVVITNVLATLERWPNVAARFRQSLHLIDEPQTGLGEYWQQGVGNQRRTCWQWQTLVDGQPAIFSQVFDKDGRLWTDMRFPARRLVTRVNMATVRREVSAATSGGAGGRTGRSAEEYEVLARGGLSQLIAELRRDFTFGPPAVLTEDGREMIAVVGLWREDELKRVWQSLTPTSSDNWPGHLPQHVVVKIGRRDLFPYAIEYRRGADAALAGSPEPAGDPLARYEFFDVRWGVVMENRLFEFTPADVDWHDVTARTVARVRVAPAAAPQPVAAIGGASRR